MTFDDILAGCIEALTQGATVDECLARYPAQAAALEPLLRVAVALRSEAQTRMSAQAFARGRSALRQQAQQALGHRQVDQRRYQAASHPNHQDAHFRYPQNGVPRPRRSPVVKRFPTTQSRWGRAMQRALSAALLLVLLVGATTLTRRVTSSLPGTFFYPIKNVGEQSIGVLMQAAGEEIPWHALQAQNGLQALAQLSQSEVATAQALVKGIEKHWERVLTATQRLPVAERLQGLQSHIASLQQLEAEWATTQTATSPTAVLTVRKMIIAGEQLLAAPPAIETVATTAPTTSPTALQTTVPTVAPTTQPTATPLLQATATLTSAPVLVGTATPEATSIELPIPATPSPTLLATVPPTATPMPVMTVQMPQESNSQESNNQESEDTDKDEDNTATAGSAISETATNAEAGLTPEATATIVDELGDSEQGTTTPSPEPVFTIEPTVTAVAVTPVIGEPPTIPLATTEEPIEEGETLPVATPLATSVENTPSTPSKSTPANAATTELLVAETPRPTNQPTATKTPKPTATPEKAATTAPDKPTAENSKTPTEKTPKPTETPRPPSTTSESTKVAQP